MKPEIRNMNIKKIIISFLILVCCCLCASLTAQTPLIDSLEQVLASGKLSNQEKTELLIDLANAHLSVDSSKCRMYCVEALQLAQNHKLKKQEGRAYMAMGNYYLHTSQYYLAHYHYKKAEGIYLKLDDKKLLIIIYNNLNLLFSIINDIENQKYYASKILEIALEQGDHVMELRARSKLFEENDSQQKIDYFLELYQKASSNNTNYIYNIALVCGEIYVQSNLPRKALPFLYQALESTEAGVSSLNSSQIYINLAEAYTLLNKLDSAEYFLKKVRNYPVIYAETGMDIFRIRYMIDSTKGNYLNALENFKKFHRYSDSINKNMRTVEIARIRNWHELEQKDFENELLHQEYQKQRKLTSILAIALVMIVVLLALAVFFYRKINEKNSELNEKNREITEKNSEMEELNNVKDKLFSVVAHDLRTPIASLTSVLKMTRKNVLDTETQAQLLKDVAKQVDNVCGLLDNLLRWAKRQMRGQVFSPVYFNVQDEINTIIDGLQQLADSKKVALNNRVENKEVYSDRDMFSAVVRNLVTNAIKYTSAEGSVTIDSELSDNMLVISIKDTGTGMSQEVQDNLFKLSETKSQRGTSNESGTGLGLVLCADFVKANGGKIWFNSVQGEGSTFFFSVAVKS